MFQCFSKHRADQEHHFFIIAMLKCLIKRNIIFILKRKKCGSIFHGNRKIQMKNLLN